MRHPIPAAATAHALGSPRMRPNLSRAARRDLRRVAVLADELNVRRMKPESAALPSPPLPVSAVPTRPVPCDMCNAPSALVVGSRGASAADFPGGSREMKVFELFSEWDGRLQ